MSKARLYLFVGGPVSGSWHATTGNPYWRVPVMMPVTAAWIYEDSPPSAIELPVAEYQFQTTAKVEYYLFVGMSR